jgi:hypothetical protein
MKPSRSAVTGDTLESPEIEKYYAMRKECHDKYKGLLDNPEALKAYNRELTSIERSNPNNARCLFDPNEPEWMLDVSVSNRQRARDILTIGTWDHPVDTRLGAALLFGILVLGTPIFDAFVCAISHFMPAPYKNIVLLSIPITNVPALYLMYSCLGAPEEDRKREKERHEHYKGKSIEYFVREAHAKGLLPGVSIPGGI